MNLKKAFIFFACFSLPLFGVSIAIGEEVPAEQWVQSMKFEDGWKALTLDETTVRETSVIYGTVYDASKGPLTSEQAREKYFCKDFLSEECKKFFTLQFRALLPVCDSFINLNCLESVYAIKENGDKVLGVFEKYTQALPFAYPPSEKYGLPAGAYPSLWKIPGVKNGSGEEQYVATPFVYGSNKFENWKADPQFKINQMFPALYAVKPLSGPEYRPIFATDASTGPGKIAGSSNSGNNMCAAQDFGTCYLKYSLPLNTKLGMTFRVSKNLNPWIHGRVLNPEIKLMAIDGSNQLVDISGNPMVIGNLGTWTRVETLTPELKEWILNAPHENGGTGDWANHASLTKTFAYNIGVSGQGNINQLKIWLPVLGDKATVNPTAWSFRFLENRELLDADSCIKNTQGLAGIVTTNAAVYSAGPPTYNKANGSLDYTVISPHFDSSGKEFLGTYNLLIKDEVARCIYGFSDAPIKAEVSIVGDSGENKVATTTVSKQGEWISLSAKGFTYSSPTIRVKLSQEKVEKAQEASSNTAAAAEASSNTAVAAEARSNTKPGALKKSITCSKGKSLKKVTGTNPKCPKGYKLVK